jgi:hypothetical protein
MKSFWIVALQIFKVWWHAAEGGGALPKHHHEF